MKNIAIALLIILSFFAYMLTIFPSGSQYCIDNLCGIYFWGAHGHDALWHLAIVAVSFNHLPFIAPTYAGALLDGYNYFLDLGLFILSKIGIPAMVSYFKILPIIWFGVFSYFLIKLSKRINNSSIYTFLLLFFVFFGGSFSYVVTWMHNKSIWGSSGLLAMQPILSLTNIQFAFSIVILTIILVIIKDAKPTFKNNVLLSFLVGLNLALKFYAGVICLFLVALYFTFILIKSRKTVLFLRDILILGIFFVFVLLLFYKPGSQLSTGSPLIFSPLATVYPLIEDPNLLYLKDMTNARYFLENSGRFSPRLLLINIQILSLFIILNFGTRIIGLIYLGVIIFKKKISQFDLLVFSTIIFSIALNILFVQKGVWWNTVQFSYYAFFLMNIFVAQSLYMIIRNKKKMGIFISILVIILTIPNSIDAIRSFLDKKGHTYLSQDEIVALKFLESQNYGVVYSPLPSRIDSQNRQPLPLSYLEDNAYVTAFSGKQSYIADEVQLELTGVDFRKRAKASLDWNCDIIGKVDYLYELRQNPIGNKLEDCKNRLKRIYKNKMVTIYEVN